MLVVVLTMVNIVVAIAAIYVADEHVISARPHGYLDPSVVTKLTLLVFAVALADGLALVPWRSTRQVGPGVIAGTVLASAALLVYVAWISHVWLE